MPSRVWGSVVVYNVYLLQSCMQMIGLYKSRNMEDSELTANFTSGGTRPSAVATSQSADNEVVLRLHQRVNELEDKLALYEVKSLYLFVCTVMHTYICIISMFVVLLILYIYAYYAICADSYMCTCDCMKECVTDESIL